MDRGALSDMAHALRIKGEYHKAIECEILSYQFRKVGQKLREEMPNPVTVRTKMHRISYGRSG